MNRLGEIESAIEGLTAAQVDELALWVEQLRKRLAMRPPADAWLERARGAALSGVTTEGVMALTRGEK
jgi:hypothetical protein